MPTSAYTDRHTLTTRAYATPAAYETRVSIYAWQRPRHDLVARAVELLHGVDGPLLDIGCGSGHYTRGLRVDRPDRPVVAADLSAGMARTAGPPETHTPILDRVHNRAREAIDRDGAFTFGTHSGFLVCRR